MPDAPTPPPTPRWVKVAGAVAALIAVVIVVLLVAGGDHGPRRHFGDSPATPAHTPPPGVDHGEQP